MLSALVLAALGTTLPAQCGADWQNGAPSAGPDGTVASLLTLPNGEVIAGGTFAVADGAIVNNVARWDGTTWRALGSGPGIQVRSAAWLPNGDLLTAGGGSSIFRTWNGTAWSAALPGITGTVNSLLVLPTGEIVAGGALSIPSATSFVGVAIWNGTSWSSLGTGLATATVTALTRLANGDIVAAGSFGPYPLHGLERWNGTTWQSIPGFDPAVDANVTLASVRTNGDLVFAGTFRINGVNASLGIWNGAAMQPVSPPTANFTPLSMLAAANGDVLVSGVGVLDQLQRWNGATWQPVSGSHGATGVLAEDATGRIVAHYPQPIAYPHTISVRRFDGVGWTDLGADTPPVVGALLRLPTGDVVAGGTFSSLDGVVAANIARWNGVAWAPLGLGVNGSVTALARTAAGDVIAAGRFSTAGGAPATSIARWNGSTWTTLGAGLILPSSSTVSAVAVTGNGDILASYSIGGISRFDGLQWSPLALPGTLTLVNSMVSRGNGDVVIGGTFLGFGALTGMLVYSNGLVSPAPGVTGTFARVYPGTDDTVLVGGIGLGRWDGQTLTPLQAPPVNALAYTELPNGELVGCGSVQTFGGTPTSCLYRQRASGWETWGEILGGNATCLTATPRGELLVGGAFRTAGGVVSLGLARSATTCPASSSIVGAGCSGGAGPVTLTTANGAWLGSSFRATTSGMAANSLALQVVGTPATVQALPGGAPGCSLFVLPLLTDLLVPSGGTATSAFVVPNQPALVGQQFRLQVIGIELGPNGIVRITSTNALQETIGDL